MSGLALPEDRRGAVPVWLLLAVAALQVVVLAQVALIDDRLVQLEAGAEFLEYGQSGCTVPEGPPPSSLPGAPAFRQGPAAALADGRAI
jgi:hypothetical protein